MMSLNPGNADISQSLTVLAGGQRFAVARSAVREIVRMPKLTPVPHSPPGLLGLAHIRGETLAIVAAGVEAGAPLTSVKARHILLFEQDNLVGLAIDGIEPNRVTQTAPAELAWEELVQAAAPSLIARGSKNRPLVSAASKPSQPNSERYLHVNAGGQPFCIPAIRVADIVKLQAPSAATTHRKTSAASGLAWRNRSIRLASLATLVGLEARGSRSPSRMIVVVEVEGQTRGLEVDEICGLIEVASDRVAPVPAALLQTHSATWIDTICRPTSGPDLIPVLACDRILSATPGEDSDGVTASDVPQDRSMLSPGHLRYLLAQVGPYRIGFPVDEIRVSTLPEGPTPVPASPSWLRGVTFDRGEPLMIVDPLMMWTGRQVENARRLVILDGKADRLGLIVEEAREIIAVDPNSPSPSRPLPPLTDVPGEAVRGTADGVVLIEDTHVFVSTIEHRLTGTRTAA